MSDVPCQAIWWRADCEVESDLSLERQSQLFTVPHRWLVPRGQPQPYDPFDFYYPAKEAQKDHRSLPYLFTDLCPDNPEQVRSFCSRFGITGPFQDLTWQKWNQGSRDPSATRLEEGHLAGNPDRTVLRPMALAEIEKAWCKFKNFMVAAQSVKQDKLAAGWITDDDSTYRLHGWLKPAFDVSHGSGQLEGWAWAVPSTVGEARQLLEHMFAEVCGRTRARMAWHRQRQQWVWTWESLDLISLMYVMVGMDLQGPGWIRSCDGCARIFLAGRADKQYCSSECQNRTKAKRYYHEVGREKRAGHGGKLP
ncbi:MAG: hypothetical protein O7C73_05080 [Nitrospirae bacterium]|nr:hypothetical protein [Nitrospirota bacterium]